MERDKHDQAQGFIGHVQENQDTDTQKDTNAWIDSTKPIGLVIFLLCLKELDLTRGHLT